MFPRRSVPQHPGDQKILEDTRELSRQLGIRKTQVRELNWADRIGAVARFDPDQVLIYKGRELLIHKSLMDKLSSDELKPLIASALLHREVIGSKAVKGVLGYLAPAFLATFLLGYITEHIFTDSSVTSEAAILVSILFGFGLVVLSMVHIFRLFRRVWYDADKQTAQLLGVDTFLGVLEKMDAMGLGRGKPMREQPNVRDRIARLRASVQGSFLP